MSDYMPSPELVEAVADLSGCGFDTTEFVVGEAVFNWDPNQPAKISLTFGNADAITTLPG